MVGLEVPFSIRCRYERSMSACSHNLSCVIPSSVRIRATLRPKILRGGTVPSLPFTRPVERRIYAAFYLLGFRCFDSLHGPASCAGVHRQTIMNETHTWFYADGDQTFGPVDAPEIERLIQQAVISSSTWMLAEGSENWMLAKDSPFAAYLGNAPSHPDPQDQGPANAVATLVQPDLSSHIEDEQPSERLSVKLSQFGSAVLSETKRGARLASIKAVIEKLKRVDLTKAHYELGKKAYELKVDEERFSDRYREISALEETIKTKKVGKAGDKNATMLENFRGVTINAKSVVEAEAFEIRRKQLLVRIGKEYRPSLVPTAVGEELAAVGVVEAQIIEREVEYASVSLDRVPFLTLLQPWRSALPKTEMPTSRRPSIDAIRGLVAVLHKIDASMSSILTRFPLKISKITVYLLSR